MYIFDNNKRLQGPAKYESQKQLQQLLVSVVHDKECESFPNNSSDESCEYLHIAN